MQGSYPIYRTLASAHPPNARATSTRESSLRVLFLSPRATPRAGISVFFLLFLAYYKTRARLTLPPSYSCIRIPPCTRVRRSRLSGLWKARRWREGRERKRTVDRGLVFGSSHGDWCDLCSRNSLPSLTFLAHSSFSPIGPFHSFLFYSHPYIHLSSEDYCRRLSRYLAVPSPLWDAYLSCCGPLVS